MTSALLTPLLLLALQTSSESTDRTQPWDTAYIDPQGIIDNRADSVQGVARSFQGPGPILMHFESEVDTDTIDYFAWEIAQDNKFQDIIAIYRDENIDYTFSETGTYYARFNYRFRGDDGDGLYTETYTIKLTESLLQVPNLITPDSPTGTNQVFKVKYQALTSFEMWVYNRWGQQLFHTKDPAQGWDGSQSGKPVPTGAYYYLIKARGTDGISYTKKGDINVLRIKEIQK